jgi:hypothetical protein
MIFFCDTTAVGPVSDFRVKHFAFTAVLLLFFAGCRVGGTLTPEAEKRLTEPTYDAISDSTNPEPSASPSVSPSPTPSSGTSSLTLPSGLPTSTSDVVTGKSYIDQNGTWQTGALTSLGNLVISSVTDSRSTVKVDSISVNADAIVNSALAGHTDYPTAAQVLTGKYFLAANATPVLGTMTNHGAVSITSPSASYTAGYVSSLSVNADAVVAAAMGSNTDFPTASQVMTGKYFLTTTGTPILGTMTNHGAVSVTTTASYGAGYVSSLSVSPGADLVNTNIVSTKTILGVAGSAVRVGSAGTGTAGNASSLCSGRYLANSSGTAVNGTRYCAPTTLSYTTGLRLWLKADDINGNGDANTGFTYGTEVGTWNDSSGSGNHLTQAAATKLPTYQRAAGSINVVRFDGSNDYLQRTTATAADIFPSVDSVDIFVVMMHQAAQGGNAILYMPLTSTTNYVGFWATYLDIFYFNYGNNTATQGGWTVNQSSLASSSDWDGRFHIVEVYRNSTTSSELKVDGVLAGTPSALSDALDNTVANGVFTLGSRPPPDASPGYLKGDIAEILIFGSAITNSTDRTSVQCYLSNKYGFAISGC